MENLLAPGSIPELALLYISLFPVNIKQSPVEAFHTDETLANTEDCSACGQTQDALFMRMNLVAVLKKEETNVQLCILQ